MAGSAVATWLATGRHLRWGASPAEATATLPGDDLVPSATMVATRAITVETTPDRVWPWVAQLGQERGGFYSYTRLENAAGCRITNADTVVEEWQDPQVGDSFRLHPQLALRLAIVLPGEALVATSVGQSAAPAAPFDFSWAFVLRPERGVTRLVVRERYRPHSTAAVAGIRVMGLVSTVMTIGTLRGIRRRAEEGASQGASQPAGSEPGHIYHLAERSAWEQAQSDGEYRESTLGRSLDDVGFIHASDAGQWQATRARFYADYPDDLVLLMIDPARLTAPLVREVGNPATGEQFPHIYGPLPVDAVVATRMLPPPHGPGG